MNTPLSSAELVALAGCVKETSLKKAKADLSENSTHAVDFSVRVHGTVQKATGSVEHHCVEPATVSFATMPAICALLRRLGIGEKRLRQALEALPCESFNLDKPLENIFDEVAAAKAKTLKPVKKSIAAKGGAVTSQVTALKA